MRFFLIIAALLSISVLIFPNDRIYSQSSQSIYVADVHMIFQQSDAGKDAKSRLENKQKEMETILDQMKEQIDKTKASLERESMVINEKTVSEKERNLRIKVNDFKSLGMKFQQELDELQQKLVSDVEKSIISIISEMGKSEEYLMVLNKSAVLYSESTVDISDKVLDRYNAEYTKTRNRK